MIVELVLCAVLFLIIYTMNKRPANLPPGIWGWPFFGSLPSSQVSMVDQVREHSEKYGDIFSWRIGGSIYVFLCNYDVIKTGFSKLELSARPAFYSLDVFTNFVKLGLSNSNGVIWQHNRRFALRHLRSLGFGKRTYESVIQEEVSSFIKDLDTYAGGSPKPLPWSMNVAILNVIWRITADRHYEINDKRIIRFHELVDSLFNDAGTLILMYDLIPWLHKVIPDVLAMKCGLKKFLDTYDEMKTFHLEIVKEHQKSLDPNNPRDLIDYYLIDMKKEENNPESHMSILDLLMVLADLFVAASETTASTIRWAILYLSKYPEIQEKVHQELDSVVDRNNLPSLNHKDSLPYFEAVIREVHRSVTLAALSLPHAAVEDVWINEYCIPKGSVVIANLEKSHMDPTHWERPDEFYPEHFLNSEGKLIKKEQLVPFSIGKRICPGESLANMELYLFLSAMLQKFKFSLPEGVDLNRKRDPKDRIINACKPFNVIIQRRN